MKIALPLLLALVLFAVMSPALAQDAPPVDKLTPRPGQATDPEDIAALKRLIREQKKELDRLTKEIEEAREELSKLHGALKPEPVKPGGTKPSLAGQAPEGPSITGKLTKVRMETKMVLANLGSKQGVRSGDIFEVSREGKVIGKIRIGDAIYGSWCNAEVIESEIDPLPGDTVTKKAPVPEKAPPPEELPLVPAVVPDLVQKGAAPAATRTEIDDIRRRLTRLEAFCDDFDEQLGRLDAMVVEIARGGTEKTTPETAPAAQPDTPTQPEVERPASFETTVFAIRDSGIYLPAGTDDGIKVGDIFLIKRGEREIATIKVIALDTNICKAKVINKKTEIRQRDKAILQ